MSNLPTAEELFKKYSNLLHFEEGDPEYYIDKEDFKMALIEHTTFHVEAALKAASEEAKVQPYPYNSCFECGRSDMDVNKQSILNAYPKELIK